MAGADHLFWLPVKCGIMFAAVESVSPADIVDFDKQSLAMPSTGSVN